MKSKQQKLKEKLDKIFSEYTRRRYADDNGYVSCVTCGVTRIWNDHMDAGHYISRGILATRWDERNVHPQCKGCNSFGKGRMDEYALYLQQVYGFDVLQELNQLKHTITKLYIPDYEHLIEVYSRKVKDLKRNG